MPSFERRDYSLSGGAADAVALDGDRIELCLVKTPSAAEIAAFPATAGTAVPPEPISPLKKAPLTGFHPLAKHIAAKAVSPSSEMMRTI